MAQRLVVVWRSSDLICNNSLLTLLARAITLEAWALAGLSGHLRAVCIRVSKITRALARTKELNTFGGHWKQRSDDCNLAAIHSDQFQISVLPKVRAKASARTPHNPGRASSARALQEAASLYPLGGLKGSKKGACKQGPPGTNILVLTIHWFCTG